jgi:hypothetical protein
MTRKCVADEQYRRLRQRLDEVLRRVDEKTIPFEATMSILQLIIEGRFIWEVWKTIWKVWKIVELGTGLKSAFDFRKTITDYGMRVSGWDVGKEFKVATESTSLDLVRVSVAKLGFKRGATTQQIYEHAKELGLELCPAEVGPQLRLQYADQPRGEDLFIGMEPIIDSEGRRSVFCLGCDHNGAFLCPIEFGRSGDYIWDNDPVWVFVRPRRK